MSLKRMVALAVVAVAGLSGCTASMKADLAFSREDYVESAVLYALLLKDSPADAAAKARLGYAVLRLGDAGEAVRLTGEAAAASPDDPDVQRLRGHVLLAAGDLPGAAGAFRAIRDGRAPVLTAEMNRLGGALDYVHHRVAAERAVAGEWRVAPPRPVSGRIVVAPYRDTSKDGRAMGRYRDALTERMADALAAAGLDVVPVSRTRAFMDAMGLGDANGLPADEAPRLGRLLGAARVVYGALGTGSPVSGGLESFGPGVVGADVSAALRDKEQEIQARMERMVGDLAARFEAEAKPKIDAIERETKAKVEANRARAGEVAKERDEAKARVDQAVAARNAAAARAAFADMRDKARELDELARRRREMEAEGEARVKAVAAPFDKEWGELGGKMAEVWRAEWAKLRAQAVALAEIRGRMLNDFAQWMGEALKVAVPEAATRPVTVSGGSLGQLEEQSRERGEVFALGRKGWEAVGNKVIDIAHRNEFWEDVANALGAFASSHEKNARDAQAAKDEADAQSRSGGGGDSGGGGGGY